MNAQSIFDEARYMTNTDSVTNTDAVLFRGLNIYQGEFFQKLLSMQGFTNVGENEYATDFISTTGLVEGNDGYEGEYSFDSSWVKINRFEVKFDAAEDFKVCTLYDKSENKLSEVDSINDNFSKENPLVRYYRDSYVIRPLNDGATVTNGIRIWAESRQSDLDNPNQTPIGEPNFHQWYVLKLALRFGQFRPGLSRTDVLMDLMRLETKIAEFQKMKLKKNKSFTIRNLNFA